MKLHPKFISGVTDLYGPILNVYIHYRKDGRRVCIIRLASGKLLTKQYARFKMEVKLKRKLPKRYTVDHIDGDKLNDKFSNLQLLSRSANSSKGALKRFAVVLPCAYCKNVFELSRNQVNSRARSKAGPFCRKSCAGHYSKQVQLTRVTKKRKKYQVSYQEGV